MAKIIRYPVDENGNAAMYIHQGKTWAVVEQFEATMTFKDITKGAYSNTITLCDEHGRKWYMRAVDIEILLNNSKFGACKGIWIMSSFGDKYILKLVEADRNW